MSPRYAILDDNQAHLERRIGALRERLPGLLRQKICAVMIIGSVAVGRARDTSDLDLLLVLREGTPRRCDYHWWDTEIIPRLRSIGHERFPIEPLFIGRTSLASNEPHLRQAIATGLPLWDPEGLFDDESRSRS